MTNLPDPYRPGSTPSLLAGRDSELRAVREKVAMMATYGGSGGPLAVFHGPRGLGKTSLLIAARKEADDAGLLTVWAEGTASGAGTGLLAEIAGDLRRRTRNLVGDGSRLKDRLNKVNVEVGIPGAKVGAELGKPTVDTTQATVRDLLEEAALLAQRRDLRGLVLFVDEFQAALEHERAGVLQAMQAFDRDRVPVAIVVAGLPSTPSSVLEAATYGERSDFRRLGWLDDASAKEALTGPASAAGVTWTPEALNQAVTFTQGYPYAVQLLGSEAWRAADPAKAGAIDYSHVVAGQVGAERRMSDLYAARVQRLSPVERKFVEAMARLNAPASARGAIAKEMGKSTTSISEARQALLDKGFIHEASYGHLAFTVPGIDQYIRTHPGQGN